MGANRSGEIKVRIALVHKCFLIDLAEFGKGRCELETTWTRLPGKSFVTLQDAKNWVEKNWSGILTGEFTPKETS